jgi:NADPH:quinone reductase-like Zn-dependent oxidoreductase
MRAAVLTAHGTTSDVVRIVEDLAPPTPGPGQVQVRVQAVALNRLDLFVRAGWRGLHLDFPHVIAADGAGVVSQVGEGVPEDWVGQQVAINPSLYAPVEDITGFAYENQARLRILGEHAPGTAAETIVVPALNLIRLPAGFAAADAAAVGLVGVTAWHSLITRGQLRAGETVLIVGAGGGVNSMSIQIAKLAGALVAVVGNGAERCQRAMALGADFTIDRASERDWKAAVYRWTERRGVDVVVDNVGSATLEASLRSLRNGGRLLTVGGTTGYDLAGVNLAQVFMRHLSIIGSTMGPHQDYVRMMQQVFAGRLQPVIGARLPLAQAAEALDLLESGSIFGKIILEVADT